MRYGKLEAVYQRVECRLWPAFSRPTEAQHLAFRWFSEILKLRRIRNCSPFGPREAHPWGIFLWPEIPPLKTAKEYRSR